MKQWRRVVILPSVLAALSLLSCHSVLAQTEPPPTIEPLRGIKPPAPPAAQYDALVKNKRWLEALGKALFWDTAVGSNGIACASCHFHAGADPRIVNQLNPGLRAVPNADIEFGGTVGFPPDWSPAGSKWLTRGGFLDGTGKRAAPNITLAANDFPFHQLAKVEDRNSEILYDSNDVASSQGAFDGTFIGLRVVNTRTRRRDFCRAGDDTIFTIDVGGVPKKVRKVEPRNTPTAINAAFFFRNFWDGRANNVFNGVNPFGRRALVDGNDPNARIVTTLSPGVLQLEPLELKNMSLASQAVGPPNSDFEMACGGRSFAFIGRKMLTRVPLGGQRIAANDSVFGAGSPLGNLIRATGAGLRGTYLAMVQNAFQNGLWNGAGTYKITGGELLSATDGFTQAELNFSLFFGLAVDAYERTLISDNTPFDRGALNQREQRGRSVFEGKGKCVNCHNGPLLSSAAVPPRQPAELIENMVIGDGGQALYDGGFYNIGVRPTFEDVGVGGKDDYGIPLSFTRQLVSGPRVDNFPDPQGGSLDRVAVDGAFKTPSLRNIALTAPYFHNGGEKSLRDVVVFYNRGGNRRGPNGDDTTGTGPLGQTPAAPNLGGSNLDADIESLGLSDTEIDDLVAFMKALTDRRVSCHKAPFDHPELIVSNGSEPVAAGGRARDARLRLVQVGRNGYPDAWCDPNTGDLFARNLIGGMLKPLASAAPPP